MTAALPGVRVVPLTYMNSGRRPEGVLGERGGAVCTSGNAKKAFRWALSEGDAVFFFPDEHLGRNTACRLGMAPGEPLVWNPRLAALGGLAEEDLAASRAILWKGFCNVHTAFTARQVAEARAADPEVRVIVHPECPRPVVEAAEDGSTEHIIRRCAELPGRLIDRRRHRLEPREPAPAAAPDKRISCLREDICPCVTMNRIDLPKLTWCLESLAAGEVVNVVAVNEEMARLGRLALDRMLALA